MLTGVLSAGRVPCMDEHAKKRSGPSTSTPPSPSPSFRARKQQRHQRNAVVRTNNKDARKAEFRWMHQSESIWRRSRPPPPPHRLVRRALGCTYALPGCNTGKRTEDNGHIQTGRPACVRRGCERRGPLRRVCPRDLAGERYGLPSHR